jgi:hypothetical protein
VERESSLLKSPRTQKTGTKTLFQNGKSPAALSSWRFLFRAAPVALNYYPFITPATQNGSILFHPFPRPGAAFS